MNKSIIILIHSTETYVNVRTNFPKGDLTKSPSGDFNRPRITEFTVIIDDLCKLTLFYAISKCGSRG